MIVNLLTLMIMLVPLTAQPTDLSEDLRAILAGSPVPGLAAAAVLDGQIVGAGVAGVRRSGSEDALQLEDRFLIGSLTKSMTAALGAMLVSEGILSYETTVAQVFPEVFMHEDYKGARFRDLLTNTGGFPEEVWLDLWLELWKNSGTAQEQRYQLVKGMVQLAPAYTPGSGYLYSNAGFSVAGAMLERLTGISYEDLLAARLFHPLILPSAGFRAPAALGAQPFGHVIKDGTAEAIEPEPAGENPRAIAPASAVHCSILDLARYAMLHLGAFPEILSKDQLSTLHTPPSGREYAMGWIVSDQPWAGGKALMHAGSNTMFYSVIWLVPHKNFALVAMSNSGGPESYSKLDQAVGMMIGRFFR